MVNIILFNMIVIVHQFGWVNLMLANLCCSIGTVLGNAGLKWQLLLLLQFPLHFK